MVLPKIQLQPKQKGKSKMKLSNNAYHDQIEKDLVDYIMGLWHQHRINKYVTDTKYTWEKKDV